MIQGKQFSMISKIILAVACCCCCSIVVLDRCVGPRSARISIITHLFSTRKSTLEYNKLDHDEILTRTFTQGTYPPQNEDLPDVLNTSALDNLYYHHRKKDEVDTQMNRPS